MMKRFFKTAFICFVSLSFVGCQYGLQQAFGRKWSVNNKNRLSKITELAAPAVGNEYRVLILSDIHFGASKNRFPDEKLIAWLDEQETAGTLPDFCINLGDTADHGWKEEYATFNEKIYNPLKAKGIETYSILGNHDVFNNGAKWFLDEDAGLYPKTSFYHFETANNSWYFLDSGDATLGKTQLELLLQEFKDDSKQKIISLHHPVYAEDHLYFILQNSIERNTLISEFAKNDVKVLLNGHAHMIAYSDFGAFQEFNLPSLVYCAQWSVMTVNESANSFDVEVFTCDTREEISSQKISK